MSRVERRNSMRGTKVQHSYYLDGDEKLPGVTTILGAKSKGEALLYWASREGGKLGMDAHEELALMDEDAKLKRLANAHAVARDKAAKLGSQFHEFAQRIVLHEEVTWDEIQSINAELLPMLKWVVEFVDHNQFEPILTETVVWSEKFRYAGTLDLVAKSERFPGRVFLLDWKTGGVWPEVALQLAAYAEADYYVDVDGEDRPMADLGITDHVVLKVDKDLGRIVPVPVATGPEVFGYFEIIHAAYLRQLALDKTLVSKDELPQPELSLAAQGGLS